MRSGGWRTSTKFALEWSDAGVDMKPLPDRVSTVAGRIGRVRVRAVHAASSLAPLRRGRDVTDNTESAGNSLGRRDAMPYEN